MVEPRAADREDFDGMMKAFYEVVKGDLYNPYLDEGNLTMSLLYLCNGLAPLETFRTVHC
jgi:hypothetical protein